MEHFEIEIRETHGRHTRGCVSRLGQVLIPHLSFLVFLETCSTSFKDQFAPSPCVRVAFYLLETYRIIQQFPRVVSNHSIRIARSRLSPVEPRAVANYDRSLLRFLFFSPRRKESLSGTMAGRLRFERYRFVGLKIVKGWAEEVWLSFPLVRSGI